MMESLIDNPELQKSWTDYNEVRLSGNKRAATELLMRFIKTLKEYPETAADFSRELCAQVLNNRSKRLPGNGTEVSEAELRIQHPLFKEIMLPELIKGYHADDADACRWIGQLEQFFYKDRVSLARLMVEVKDQEYYDPLMFFKRSYDLKAEEFTLNLILQALKQKLDFMLHELPETILADPETLREMLSKYERYYSLSLNKVAWDDDLQEYRFWNELWQRYHQQGKPCPFSDFVKQN